MSQTVLYQRAARPDVVGLLLVVALAVTGLVSPEEAVSGFANPTTVTVLARLILAGGLSRTGASTLVGEFISRLASPGQWRLLAISCSPPRACRRS